MDSIHDERVSKDTEGVESRCIVQDGTMNDTDGYTVVIFLTTLVLKQYPTNNGQDVSPPPEVNHPVQRVNGRNEPYSPTGESRLCDTNSKRNRLSSGSSKGMSPPTSVS